MPRHAKAPVDGRGKRNGKRATEAAVPAMKTSVVGSHSSTTAIDPVRTWRAVARHMSDHELRVWQARITSVLTFAEFESLNPDHDRQIINWQIEAIEAELESRRRRENMPAGTSGGFTDTFIQDLKQRLPLFDLIQNLGDPLQKSGKQYRGDCPFHDSKSGTSLTVSEDVWYCFGCQRGGDVYTWLAERWDLEFPDAVRTLASLTGTEIPKQSKPSIERSNRRVVNVTGRAVRRAN